RPRGGPPLVHPAPADAPWAAPAPRPRRGVDASTRTNTLPPPGHLGYPPIARGSFEIAVPRRPDAIVADSGSCDIGPQPLGADEPCSPEDWQRHDLELLLLAARRLGVPMIVGSASDSGTDRGVNQYAEIIRGLAQRHELA